MAFVHNFCITAILSSSPWINFCPRNSIIPRLYIAPLKKKKKKEKIVKRILRMPKFIFFIHFRLTISAYLYRLCVTMRLNTYNGRIEISSSLNVIRVEWMWKRKFSIKLAFPSFLFLISPFLSMVWILFFFFFLSKIRINFFICTVRSITFVGSRTNVTDLEGKVVWWKDIIIFTIALDTKGEVYSRS